ncbi:hypothetical protein GLOTRDRAFT_120420 [Gloeophyllum trabeum ATCC 11539]|uniref:Uncharacterized protein n=1 Tax=Gloeophyllum trabeum (strain ATCC 11539 / FP-39264 / Madison 617) TaxID=670483 RepID=S7RR44_GLOTA|nr:uncharacterized protein GLOTRDRAFT_120420 [Gloeophyllum trabeum ATCC 11539]EPQ57070.1 hypothetical protein GLOTRDRAFT_120420 [Gloeophyllum trabeum ATCC 11539]
MPLFGKSHRSEDTKLVGNDHHDAPNRSGSMFSGRRSTDANHDRDRAGSPTSTNGSSWFRRSSSPSDRSGHGSDPSIVNARRKVSEAEEAERAAERALSQARYAARDAKEHVKMLEREAQEDAKRAKAKQAEAKSMNKTTKGLGRI